MVNLHLYKVKENNQIFFLLVELQSTKSFSKKKLKKITNIWWSVDCFCKALDVPVSICDRFSFEKLYFPSQFNASWGLHESTFFVAQSDLFRIFSWIAENFPEKQVDTFRSIVDNSTFLVKAQEIQKNEKSTIGEKEAPKKVSLLAQELTTLLVTQTTNPEKKIELENGLKNKLNGLAEKPPIQADLQMYRFLEQELKMGAAQLQQQEILKKQLIELKTKLQRFKL